MYSEIAPVLREEIDTFRKEELDILPETAIWEMSKGYPAQAVGTPKYIEPFILISKLIIAAAWLYGYKVP